MKSFKTTLVCLPLIFFFDTGKSHANGTMNKRGVEAVAAGKMKINSCFNQFQGVYDEQAAFHSLKAGKYRERRLFPPLDCYTSLFYPASFSNIIARSFSYDRTPPSTASTPMELEWPNKGLLTSHQMTPLTKEARQTNFRTNPSPFLKWLGLSAFWWAAFFDHYQDAIQDEGGRKTHIFGADRRHWHFVKNLAHLGYLTAGFASGMEFGQGKITVRRFAIRMVGSVLIYWYIQRLVYDKALYDVWIDYEDEYSSHGILVFDLKGRDHRTQASEWARRPLDVVRVVGGLYLVIKY